jgi:hypothetical protein
MKNEFVTLKDGIRWRKSDIMGVMVKGFDVMAITRIGLNVWKDCNGKEEAQKMLEKCEEELCQ